MDEDQGRVALLVCRIGSQNTDPHRQLSVSDAKRIDLPMDRIGAEETERAYPGCGD